MVKWQTQVAIQHTVVRRLGSNPSTEHAVVKIRVTSNFQLIRIEHPPFKQSVLGSIPRKFYFNPCLYSQHLLSQKSDIHLLLHRFESDVFRHFFGKLAKWLSNVLVYINFFGSYLRVSSNGRTRKTILIISRFHSRQRIQSYF